MKTEKLQRVMNLTWKVSLAGLIAFGLQLPDSQSNQSRAADFKHAKKIIVPASRIPRRYDYDSMSGTVATPNGQHSYYSPSQVFTTPPSSSTKAIKKNKNGLVPPPPPVAPSLLPSSMARNIPPPPAQIQKFKTTPVNRAPKRFSPHQRQFNASTHPYGHKVSKNHASSYVVARAKKLMSTGHLKDAQELLIKNSKTFPNDPAIKNTLTEVSIERSKYYLRKDNYQEAASQARVAIKYANENKEARSVLNQALRHQGVDSLNSSARLAQATKLFTHGKLDEAKIEYDESIRLSPSHSAYIGLGNIAYSQGNMKTAKVNFQKALDIAPQSSVALRQLGITRYKLSDVVGANADLTRALVQDPSDKLASQHLIDLWQRQVATRPNDANSHLGLARAYQLSGDLNSAQNEYRTVVKIDPNHPNLPAARQSFKLALARQQAVKAYEAGQTLYAHDAFQEAFDKASLAVRLSPGNAKYKMFQAQILEKLGDVNGAKQLYLTILHDNPKNFEAAKRIKALNLIALSPNQASQNVGLLATQGRLSSNPAPQSLNVPQYRGEGPALPYLPGPNRGGTYKVPTADPVQNMTGFLGSLRDLMLKQKKALQANEDEILNRINPSSSSTTNSTSSSSAASKIANIDTSVAPLDVGKLISNDDIQKAISSAPAASAPSTTNASSSSSTAPTTSTTSSATPKSWSELAISTGQSLANDTRLKSLANMAATAAPTVLNKNFKPEDAQRILQSLKTTPLTTSTKTLTEAQAASTTKTTQAAVAPASAQSAPLVAPSIASTNPVQAAPTTVRQSQSAPPLAPPIQRAAVAPVSQVDNRAYANRISNLEYKNQQLLNQLSEAHKQISTLKTNSASAISPTTTNNANNFSESVQGKVEPPVNTANVSTGMNEHIAMQPKLKGAIPQPISTAKPKQVHLELLGVKAKSKNINLKVRLRNEQDSELVIPSNRKAIIRMVGHEDQTAKIKFPKRKLQAHSTMEGYIKVPGKRLSPAADVFIPQLAGMSDTKENVHLTLPVPISSLNTTNQ